MNKCNNDFLNRNGIKIEEISQNVDTHIYSRQEINAIVADYNFQSGETTRDVSIADILGYNETGIPSNIFHSMDYFFDENGDGYLNRSVGMLEYAKDTIMQKLQESFKQEPISLIKADKGKYTVFTNGLHRFTLLRILYLSEVAQAKNNPDKLLEIARKYTIPAKITGIDFEKTYCKFLLFKAWPKNPQCDVRRVLSECNNAERTGKTVVEYFNEEKQILDNGELISLTRQRVSESVNLQDLQRTLQRDYNQFESFRNFMDANFADLIPLKKQELEEREQK